MKNSGVKVKLGNYVGILSGYAFGSDNFNTKSIGMPLVRIRDVDLGKTDTYYSGEYDPKYLVEKGDLLISMDGDFRISIWNSDEALLNQRVCKIQSTSKELDNSYLYYFLPKVLSNIQNKTSFVTVKHLSINKILDIEMYLPPISEQKKIVDKLDRMNLLIRKRKEAIDLLDQYLKNVFLEMFGDPISNPKKWPTKTIEEIVKKEKYSIKRGPFGGSLKKDVFVEEGYLVYEQFHALNRDFSFARYYIDEKKFQELKAFEVKAGDIIISCSGVYLGKLAEIPQNYKKGIINQALLKISLNNEIMRNKLFMDIFTNPSFKAKYLDNKIGSGIPNFPPVSVFKTFQFICPEMNIQQEYENKVKEVENLRMKMLEQVSELEQLMQSLNQKYFSN